MHLNAIDTLKPCSHVTVFFFKKKGMLLLSIVSMVTGWITERMDDGHIQSVTIDTMLNHNGSFFKKTLRVNKASTLTNKKNYNSPIYNWNCLWTFCQKTFNYSLVLMIIVTTILDTLKGKWLQNRVAVENILFKFGTVCSFWLKFVRTLFRNIKQRKIKQESFPIGCEAPACQPYMLHTNKSQVWMDP